MRCPCNTSICHRINTFPNSLPPFPWMTRLICTSCTRKPHSCLLRYPLRARSEPLHRQPNIQCGHVWPSDAATSFDPHVECCLAFDRLSAMGIVFASFSLSNLGRQESEFCGGQWTAWLDRHNSTWVDIAEAPGVLTCTQRRLVGDCLCITMNYPMDCYPLASDSFVVSRAERCVT